LRIGCRQSFKSSRFAPKMTDTRAPARPRLWRIPFAHPGSLFPIENITL
jgi:hypothetical protein